jgi:hypothetical protein
MDFEGVPAGRERELIGHGLDQLFETRLHLLRQLDVLDSPTAHADEVMVVPGQPLGEFVAGQPFEAVVRLEDAGIIEDAQAAIERGQRHIAFHVVVKLGSRSRPIGSRQGVDDSTASPCVTDAGCPETSLDVAIDGVGSGHWIQASS